MKAKTRAGSRKAARARMMLVIMESMENAVALSIRRGLATFKKKVSREELERLFTEGRFNEILDAVPWDDLPKHMTKAQRKMEAAALRGSDFAVEELKAPAKALVVAPANQKVRSFVSNTVGNLIVEVTNSSKRAVQSAVNQSFQQGLTPKQTAKLIPKTIGLTEKQQAKIMRIRLNEVAQRQTLQRQLEGLDPKSFRARAIRGKLSTLTDAHINRRMEKRTEAAIKNRSVVIARTEMTRAVNEGQNIVWGEAADRGLIDRDKTEKVWVTVPDRDRSDICTELDGKRAPLDGTFYSEILGQHFTAPPAHPNCRSSIVLETK